MESHERLVEVATIGNRGVLDVAPQDQFYGGVRVLNGFLQDCLLSVIVRYSVWPFSSLLSA
jgi:hypothetical protein